MANAFTAIEKEIEEEMEETLDALEAIEKEREEEMEEIGRMANALTAIEEGRIV